MKVAVANHLGRISGGLEAYLSRLVPALDEAGHEVALLYEREGGSERQPIAAPAGAPRWCIAERGRASALASLAQWEPDVIFTHGLADPNTERAMLAIAPGVLFAHAYYGACISGSKSRLSPGRAPCPRALGWPCLMHYLPRRCGGLNPLTMLQLYKVSIGQRDLLPAYRAIVTASPHMRAEYTRYGVPEERVHVVDLMLPTDAHRSDDRTLAPGPTSVPGGSESAGGREWRLLFIGRLSDLKGVAVLLDALEHVRHVHAGPVAVTIVGDGPEREKLHARARRAERDVTNVSIRFTGWLDAPAQVAHLQSADLLIVPSVWPEPFGLVGPEAGLFGVPAVAFRVGGIPAWLEDGVNGHLAPGRQPNPRDLAAAIVRSLGDPVHHAELRRGALRLAQRFTLDRHMTQILPILEGAVVLPSEGTFS